MGAEVDLATLASIARSLRRGGDDVEGIGGGSPGSVDAGEMTGLVQAVLAEVLDNAAVLCEGLNNAAAGVDESREGYEASEDAAALRFQLRPGGA